MIEGRQGLNLLMIARQPSIMRAMLTHCKQVGKQCRQNYPMVMLGQDVCYCFMVPFFGTKRKIKQKVTELLSNSFTVDSKEEPHTWTKRNSKK